ncbi:kinase-like domain-containing protein [Pelagophyceae sp. CCMP2097]|nr:kinase-like domain-containing protein [Pelagophyceae sp. CCMP2097]
MAAHAHRPMGLRPPSPAPPSADRITRGIPNARYSECSNESSTDRSHTGTASSRSVQGHQWPEMLLRTYEIGGVIGRGASSEVFSVRKISTGEGAALKRIHKSRSCVSARATRRLRDEVRVLSTLRHAHIVQMREVFETPTALYIIMERAMGGELFDRIVEKGSFSEAEAATVTYQLLSALADMHKRGMIHRDIKPENLLLTTKDGWELKLSDFGLVKTLEEDELPEPRVTPEASPIEVESNSSSYSSAIGYSVGRSMAFAEIAERFGRARTHTLCGSPYYMAPEVCARERYGPAVDVWSAGVVLYILLTGSPPWERPPQFGAPPNIDVDGELAGVSKEGVDLLLKMLRPLPADRLSAAEALEHPWIQRRLCRPIDLVSPHYAPSLRAFVEKRKRGSANAGHLDMTPVARALGDSMGGRGFGCPDEKEGASLSLGVVVHLKKGRLPSVVDNIIESGDEESYRTLSSVSDGNGDDDDKGDGFEREGGFGALENFDAQDPFRLSFVDES